MAAAVQPVGYSWPRDTISALAGGAASHPWVMTVALLGVGLCHLVTAAGLRAAAVPGRVVLGLGGVATAAVAAFPLSGDGSSTPHAIAATVAFVALALWPVFATRPVLTPRPVDGWRAGAPPAWGLRSSVTVLVSSVLITLLVWFVVELAGITLGRGDYAAGQYTGLAERVSATAQALWPLVVVLTLRRRRRSVDQPAPVAARREG